MKVKKTEIGWRRLDNSAKIFPISSSKKFSTVFRMSAVLKDDIDVGILNKSLEITLKKFSAFKVKIKKGFFWYYFEDNTKNPIIEEEHNYPCKYIDPRENKDYLFKVTYFKNKINVDTFHALTDGSSAVQFLKELVYNYIELKHNFKKSLRSDRKYNYTTEDSYMTNYDKHAKRNMKNKKAFAITGRKLPLDAISITHEIIELPKLKEIAKQKGVTITQFLTAVLLKSIYDTKYDNKRPIKICIPVNLKKYFNSITISNFFAYITVVTEGKYDALDEIIKFVKNDFDKKLTKEELTKTMSANVKLGNNFFIKILPLPLKQLIVKLSYIEIRKYTTTTFSNIGRFGIIAEYMPYIDNFLFMLAPESVEKIKCAACSYDDKLVFTFSSIIEDKDVENRFCEILQQNGIKVEIETNGVV